MICAILSQLKFSEPEVKKFINFVIFAFNNFEYFFFLAYGKVYLVRKKGGMDHGKLYAMKVLKKAAIVQKKKTAEHTKTERQVRFI